MRDHGAGQLESVVLAEPRGRGLPQPCARYRSSLARFPLQALEQRRQIRPGVVHPGEQRRLDLGHLQLVERAGRGARKARRVGDGREIAQRIFLHRVKTRTRDHRFKADTTCGCHLLCRQARQCQLHHQFDQAAAGDAEQPATSRSHRGRTLVRGRACRRDQQGGASRHVVPERTGGRQPGARRQRPR